MTPSVLASTPTRAAAAAALTAAALALGAPTMGAHKPITSPYTYNADVFPIVRDRCGACHVDGGPAPMSLLTYKDAYPWGESIRTELVAGHMPPWPVDTAPERFRNAQALTARELNVLLTWVTGGNPQGDGERPLAERPRGWRLGPPDLIVAMPEAITVPADATERTEEITLPIDSRGDQWVRAVDLLPGNAALVRSATIGIRVPEGDGPGRGPHDPVSLRPERVLAAWVPGEPPVPLERGAAFLLPAGAALTLRVHYKKTWQHEREAMTDRSAVGLYFAEPPAAEVQALALSPDDADRTPAPAHESSGADGISLTRTIDRDLRAVAIYPDAGLTQATVSVTARRPDGSQVEVIRFRPQPDWVRRYWFADPIALPAGTRISVRANFEDELLPPSAAPPAGSAPDAAAVRLTLDVVPVSGR